MNQTLWAENPALDAILDSLNYFLIGIFSLFGFLGCVICVYQIRRRDEVLPEIDEKEERVSTDDPTECAV